MMLDWLETLDGPRSLVTGSDIALVALEDPGVIDIRGQRNDRALGKAVKALSGAPLPSRAWTSTFTDPMRVAWRGPDRWWVLLPRAAAPHAADDLAAASGKKAIVTELTGSLAALRLVGGDAGETLARTCPLDLRGVKPDDLRATTLYSMPVILLREAQESVTSWLILVPRSYAQALAEELVATIKTTARLDLFGTQVPPV